MWVGKVGVLWKALVVGLWLRLGLGVLVCGFSSTFGI